MRHETIQAITAVWNRTGIDEQKKLIRAYLEQYGTSETGQWMEFLLDQFELDDTTPLVATPQKSKGGCCNGCSL